MVREEKAPRQSHVSSGDEKVDDDEDDALNIQPPQAKTSSPKDGRQGKDEKRKHARSHSRDKDRKKTKRSRSAEKGKPSRGKDSDRERDRDQDRGQERRRDRDRDHNYNSRDKDKKSRKEPQEDSRAAPSGSHSHHEDIRPSGSSSQSHQPDLRQMHIDRRDDTRQVTVVGDRVQQKETERKSREGKKESEGEKERREDRHEERPRDREKRGKSRDSSTKHEGTKEKSRSRRDELIEERREVPEAMSTYPSGTWRVQNLTSISDQVINQPVSQRQCAVCSVYFVKNRKGFRRIQLVKITSPRTISKVFHKEDILYNYICENCKYKLVKQTVRNKRAPLKSNRKKRTYRSPPRSPAAKREAASSTPETSREPAVREPQDKDEHHVEGDKPETSGESHDPRKKINTYLDKKQYLRAFRALYKSSEDAKSAMVEATCEILKTELSKAKRIPSFSQEVSAEAIGAFSWTQACNEAKDAIPATLRCIETMTSSLKATMLHNYKGTGSKTRHLDHDEAVSMRCRRVGQLLSTILYQRSKIKYSFVPGCVAIELWRQSVSQKVFITLNKMGITQGVQGSRSKVADISESHDKQLWEWKRMVEERRSDPQRRLTYKFHPIYSFCTDNIQVSKPGIRDKKSAQTMSFAVKHRVQTVDTKSQVPASQLDPYTFLPSPEVLERQRERAIFIVRKILLEYIPQLQHLKSKVPQRILHKHTEDMQAKSECVTLGVVDADPSTTEGMIQVMENLQQYVPVVEGKPVPCLLNGDSLAIESILNAQRARSNGKEWDDRLEGLHACPQEFHKEMCHLQDSNNKFFSGASLADRGTIAQLKDNFDYLSFMGDVMQSRFQTIWELYEFSTEGHVLLCAMRLCGMKQLDDVPKGLPTSNRKTTEQIRWINQLSQQIVDFCWTSPDQADIHVAAEAFSEAAKDLPETALQHCVCHSESNDNMVMCCSRTCKHSWFHLACVGLTQAPDADTDWFCSTECEQSDSYIYCICHKKHGPCGENEVIQCHLADKCKRYKWYHRGCLGIKQDENLQEPWYCGETCALGAENDDPVLNHTKALMYDGLCHLVRREAVREGNGPAMIDDWKADMLHFHEKDHPEYLINGHYLLACVGGFADPHLQISYMWNRVANATGKPGGNIGLDQTNLHVRLDYKEMLLASRGRFTEDQKKMCAQMSGPFGSSLDAMLTNANVADLGVKHRKERREEYEDDIVRFVQEYQQDALFDYIPGREHSAFQGFEHHSKVHDPKQLGEKLKQLSNNLDMTVPDEDVNDNDSQNDNSN